MTTNILALPLLTFPMVVGTNEDWLDSWAYLDATGNPISLAGLVLNMMLRRTVDDAGVAVVASTAGTVAGLAVNGTILVTGNVLGLDIPVATMSRIAPGSYVWEVQAQGDGIEKTIGTGVVTVNRGIVR